jgi:hypothetical protein
MLEKDTGWSAHRESATSSAIETGLSQINDPKQGARLVRAFLPITDPTLHFAWRSFRWVEKVGSGSRGIVIVIFCSNVGKCRGG